MTAPATSPPAPPASGRAPEPDPPRGRGRFTELNELARTTPGVLTLLAAALVLVSVLVGVLTAIGVQARATALDDLATSSGPLSVAAQDIYRSLSDADATATGAFLAGGEEPAGQRSRYENDIAQAESSLALAVAAREPADVTAEGSPLATLSAKLSVYTGLVETARANNHQGLPVGAAYQREASNLMRTQLLPAAEDLYRSTTAQVADREDEAGAFPIVELLLGLIAIGLLVVAQRYLRRRSNRVFNVGLLVATGAALVSLVWVLIASLGARANVDDGRDVFAGMDSVARARIDTLTARADETLTLVARGSGTSFEEDYAGASKRLARFVQAGDHEGLDDAATGQVRSAGEAYDAWSSVHEDIRSADDGGNYTEAVRLAIGPDRDGAAAQFDAVDSALGKALDATTDRFDDEVAQASGAVTGAVLGVIVLAVLMAAGSVVGIWQRLKEYR
jgi:hypothetical protein